jgi:hypothetical protein
MSATHLLELEASGRWLADPPAEALGGVLPPAYGRAAERAALPADRDALAAELTALERRLSDDEARFALA